MKTSITFTIFFICFVADSQTWARLIIGGNAAGNAELDEPILVNILGLPIALDGRANAAAQGQALIGRGLNIKGQASVGRGLNIKGQAAGSADLDEPIQLVLLGAPISLFGGGSAQGHGQVNIGSKRHLVVNGNAGGTAELDEPIDLNILGLPIGFSGKGAGNAEGSLIFGN